MMENVYWKIPQPNCCINSNMDLFATVQENIVRNI